MRYPIQGIGIHVNATKFEKVRKFVLKVAFVLPLPSSMLELPTKTAVKLILV